MRAKDIMSTSMVTVPADSSVQEVANVLLQSQLSAVPVVGADGKLLGTVSKGDLMRYANTGIGQYAPWRSSPSSTAGNQAMPFIKFHGDHAQDVMTRHITAVDEDATLEEISEALEKNRIKHIPVVRSGKLVGIVCRDDLLHGLAARRADLDLSAADHTIKSAVLAGLSDNGVHGEFLRVVVADGVVQLWGVLASDAEKQAACLVAESVPGVKRVQDKTGVLATISRKVPWG